MLVFIGLGAREFALISATLLFIPILPLWVIFKKSGQNPLFSLLALLPGLGLVIALYVAAFSDWRTDK